MQADDAIQCNVKQSSGVRCGSVQFNAARSWVKQSNVNTSLQYKAVRVMQYQRIQYHTVECNSGSCSPSVIQADSV